MSWEKEAEQRGKTIERLREQVKTRDRIIAGRDVDIAWYRSDMERGQTRYRVLRGCFVLMTLNALIAWILVGAL